MLLQKVLLAAVAAGTAYASPCKPATARTSTSVSAGTSSTDATKETDIVSTGIELPIYSMSTVLESTPSGAVTSVGSTSTAESLVSVSQSSDAEAPSTDTATSETISVDTTTTGSASTIATGVTTDALTDDSTTDYSATETTQPTSELATAVTTEATGSLTETTQPTTEPVTTVTTELTSSVTDVSTTEYTITEGATTTADFCAEHPAVISALAFDPTASPFCVSYLSMPTHTVTEYETTDPTNVYQIDLTTVTADALTRVETGYDGVTVLSTYFTTTTEWSKATVTSTRSVETITCLSSAYSYTTPVPTFDSGSGTPGKRSDNAVDIPLGLPRDWSEAQTSEICSCLEFEAPTTTTVITQTVEPTTFITASTDVVTPIEEYTDIITTTSVQVVTSTVTEKRTSTTTGWVVETTFADNNDIYYRRFNCPFNANIYDDGFTTNYFKGKTPLSSGYMQSLEFSTCTSMTLPGSGTFDHSQAALVVNAYFYAKETGTYTFSVPDTIDNWGYLWLGDAAYSRNHGGWSIQGTRTGQNSALWRGGSFPIALKKGDAIPFTYLWANGGGCAGNSLNVRTPGGVVVPGMRGSTVKACNAAQFA
ncbi:hypothetical protein NW752_011662 [Fusarium irregulare]|uniref:PA14 domain-containing protein n=1 Tax=Fusarium irregulare TaxID=2494466 RepID=A0A9W8PEY7_9HYPO|nr:hypothetical protein NW766_012482 [Fusarium irregulare]KAJ4004565.1 hypothetical protein NW752_011662 [Fusarium irregulare]